MTVKGKRLYVQLSASQARKRLQGVGLGVRKVLSVGRNRAAIVHTATGDHLRELEQIFADAHPSDREVETDAPIEEVRNLGPQSCRWLRDIGILTREELRRHGPVTAFLRVRQVHPEATLNLLWAMAAGLEDRDWRDLAADEKEALTEAWRRLEEG